MGGSGDGGGGGGKRRKPDVCALLAFDALLQSPVLAVLGQIRVGDVLDLEARQIGGSHAVLAVFKGNVAGTIMNQSATRLLACILDGHVYKATVNTIAVPTCKVSIAHV
jgi:hypothetical protein